MNFILIKIDECKNERVSDVATLQLQKLTLWK
jgi:hypothetical protein